MWGERSRAHIQGRGGNTVTCIYFVILQNPKMASCHCQELLRDFTQKAFAKLLFFFYTHAGNATQLRALTCQQREEESYKRHVSPSSIYTVGAHPQQDEINRTKRARFFFGDISRRDFCHLLILTEPDGTPATMSLFRNRGPITEDNPDLVVSISPQLKPDLLKEVCI